LGAFDFAVAAAVVRVMIAFQWGTTSALGRLGAFALGCVAQLSTSASMQACHPRWYLVCDIGIRGGIMNRGTDDTQAMTSAACRDNSYRVEVSGWDAGENFFVEKTSLDWRERERKTVALHATVRLDSVLFVRLLGPLGGGADFPVPHRAVRVEDSSKDASCTDAGLVQMQPRRTMKDGADRAVESLGESSLNR
jgi:hypothetical protein